MPQLLLLFCSVAGNTRETPSDLVTNTVFFCKATNAVESVPACYCVVKPSSLRGRNGFCNEGRSRPGGARVTLRVEAAGEKYK